MNNQIAESPERQLEILTEKLRRKIDEGNQTSKSMLEHIESEGSMLEDFIAPLGNGQGARFESNGNVKMVFGERHLSLHPHASFQAAEKLAVPPTYLRNLVESKGEDNKWRRDLAAKTLNEHATHSSRQRVLVRTVGDEIRGVLSDSYRRLNSTQIYASAIQAANKVKAPLVSAYADDTRSWLEWLLPDVFTIPTANNGTVYLAFGARLASSDFGDGALDFRSYWLQVVCLNGAVGESLMRQVHLGARIPDDIKMSERTYQLDTRTQASAINDIMMQVFSKNAIMSKGKMIQDASAKVVEMDNEIKRLPKVGLTKVESDSVRKVLVENNPENGIEGGSTLWRLSQAVATIGRDTENKRRANEIAEISGALLKNLN